MTGIQWTDKTWNPVVGCTPVSPGCLNCYAATMAVRLEGMGTKGYELRRIDADGRDVTTLPGLHCETDKTVRIVEKRAGRAVFTGDVRLVPERLTEPLKWRKPAMCFLGSMADVFHESVPFDYIDQIMAVIALCPDTIFQLPTKRPERMAEYMNTPRRGQRVCEAAIELNDRICREVNRTLDIRGFKCGSAVWPPRNLWLGTSIESDDYHARAWAVLECQAAVRFLSLEPLIGPVDLDKWELLCKSWSERRPTMGKYIDWVIVGGESGSDARPCNVEWIRSVVKQCKASDVPVFVKQLGAYILCDNQHIADWEDQTDGAAYTRHNPNRPTYQGDIERVYVGHKKGGDMAEWPEDLRVREWPKAHAQREDALSVPHV